MDPAETGELTRLLRAHHAGDRGAFDALVSRVYDELSRIAHLQLRRHRPGATLDTVALVHEAYLRLAEESGVDWQGRGHFFAVAARAMRFVLVDRARRAMAGKRGAGIAALPLDEGIVAEPSDAERVLAVHEAVERLQALDPRLARLIECRFFVGLDDAEVAEVLELSPRTVQRDWLRAKAWLQRLLASPAPSG